MIIGFGWMTIFEPWRTMGNAAPGGSRSDSRGQAWWAERLSTGETIHVHDLVADTRPNIRTLGYQQVQLATELFLLLRCFARGSPIGCIVIRRTEVRPFSEKHMNFSKPLPIKR